MYRIRHLVRGDMREDASALDNRRSPFIPIVEIDYLREALQASIHRAEEMGQKAQGIL